MDPRKHENWTYFGSHDKLSALQVRSRSSNSVRERRQFSFLGQNFLRNSSICEQLHQIRHLQNFADPQEEEDVPTSSGVVAARSKAKAKPQPRESTGTTTTIPLSERVWIDIEPSKPDLESYNLSKKAINLLRHNQKLHREEDGAIQFYKIKFHLRDYHLPIQNWSDYRWLACLAAGGGSKRRYQYCSDYFGSIIYLRAHQGHSGDSLIDLALQDNVLIGPGVFPYIYRVGSNFSLSSILSNGLMPGGQNLSRRQSETKITEIQRTLTILYRVMHDTCKTLGKGIKIRYSGSILILESLEKD